MDRAGAKLHLRIDTADEDSRIDDLVSAAVAELDGADGTLGRALITQDWRIDLEEWPDGALRLPLPPLVSVVSVQYYDTAGAIQTLSNTQYTVAKRNQAHEWAPAAGVTLPDLATRPDAVQITIRCGYGTTAASVPADIRQALLLRIGDLYANRGDNDDGNGAERAMASLLTKYRVPA